MRASAFFYSFIVITLFLMVSCDEADPIPKNTSSVSVGELKYQFAVSSPGSRINNLENWDHVLEENISINLRNTETGENFVINLKDGIFPSESVNVPLGLYEVSGQSSQESISEFLPFFVDENVLISDETTILSLLAETNFGLITLDESEVKNDPNLIDTNFSQIPINQGFYYFYAEMDMDLSLIISPRESPISFEYNFQTSPLDHHHINLEFEGEENNPVQFLNPDFTFSETVIEISSEGYPSNLSPREIATLAESQNENSGLAFFEGRLFSINDSGNTPEIFELDQETGQVVRSISVTNVANVDWEDLAQSDTHLYIGDFGNNAGNRQDLKILKIAWIEVLGADEVVPEVISFSYEDQSDFSGSNPNHDFDCEAFVLRDNQFHLFTKNRSNSSTNHYSFSESNESNVATRISTFETAGQVTGASLNESDQLALIGYKLEGFNSETFIWEIENFNENINSLESRRYNIGSPLSLGQNEGIIHKNDNAILISAEAVFSGPFQTSPNLIQIRFPTKN